MTDDPRVTLTDRTQVYPEHRNIIPDGPRKGQQEGYVVLAEEEIAKGYVRPFRKSYRHVGAPAVAGLRDLTEEERERYDQFGYVKFQQYPPERSPVTGRYWRQADLDRVGKGCGVVTTMGDTIAATYARDPHFYSGTFCCGCGTHFPVGESGEFVWDGTDERVGT